MLQNPADQRMAQLRQTEGSRNRIPSEGLVEQGPYSRLSECPASRRRGKKGLEGKTREGALLAGVPQDSGV